MTTPALPPQLMLEPDQQTYTFAPTAKFSRFTAGGPSEFDVAVRGAPNIVSPQWSLNSREYAYMVAFYRTKIKRGAFHLGVYLITDDGVQGWYRCLIVVNGFVLRSQSGDQFVVAMSLHVKEALTYA